MYQLHFKEEPVLNHCFLLNPTLEGKALFVSFQPDIGRVFVNENNWFHPHIEEGKELRVDALLPPWYIFFPSLCNASVNTTANMSHLPLSTPLAHRIIHSWHSVPLSLLLLPTCERIRQRVLEAAKSGDTTCTLSRHQFHLSIPSPATLPLTGFTIRYWSRCESIVTDKWPLWNLGVSNVWKC